MKKAFPALVLILVIISGLTGCTQDKVEDQITPGDSSQDASGETEADTDGEETSADTPDEPQILSDTGSYVGLADNNFFEVQLNEDSFIVLMLTEATREKFNALALETGDGINFDYYTNEYNQNILVEIMRK